MLLSKHTLDEEGLLASVCGHMKFYAPRRPTRGTVDAALEVHAVSETRILLFEHL